MASYILAELVQHNVTGINVALIGSFGILSGTVLHILQENRSAPCSLLGGSRSTVVLLGELNAPRKQQSGRIRVLQMPTVTGLSFPGPVLRGTIQGSWRCVPGRGGP